MDKDEFSERFAENLENQIEGKLCWQLYEKLLWQLNNTFEWQFWEKIDYEMKGELNE
jgi:hypothetical protein